MLYVYSSSLWLSDMTSVILADELPHDVTGAEELIQRLQEHKTEIDARKTSIDLFLRKGKKLVASNHYAKDEVKTLTIYSPHSLPPSLPPSPFLHILTFFPSDTREDELSWRPSQQSPQALGDEARRLWGTLGQSKIQRRLRASGSMDRCSGRTTKGWWLWSKREREREKERRIEKKRRGEERKSGDNNEKRIYKG